MKRKTINLISIVLLLIAVITACKSPVDGVNIDKELLLAVGQTKTITPTFVPPDASNQNVTWESSDSKVATVDNGKVTGKSAGKATITVKTQDGGKTAKCYVTVIQPIEPVMVWVEGGTFTMGCTDGECNPAELPTHQVTLNSFYIGKYQITQKEWFATMLDNPSYHRGDNIPVHYISRNDAEKYISTLNAATGKKYRLPTEAEWEYAARGGNKSQGYIYSGSDDIDAIAWYQDNCHAPRNVGTKQPNELGIYDMSGNVWEVCSDWWSLYTENNQTNPTGPATGTLIVMRGGAWNMYPMYIRVAARTNWAPETRALTIGFRLVLSE